MGSIGKEGGILVGVWFLSCPGYVRSRVGEFRGPLGLASRGEGSPVPLGTSVAGGGKGVGGAHASSAKTFRGPLRLDAFCVAGAGSPRGGAGPLRFGGEVERRRGRRVWTGGSGPVGGGRRRGWLRRRRAEVEGSVGSGGDGVGPGRKVSDPLRPRDASTWPRWGVSAEEEDRGGRGEGQERAPETPRSLGRLSRRARVRAGGAARTENIRRGAGPGEAGAGGAVAEEGHEEGPTSTGGREQPTIKARVEPDHHPALSRARGSETRLTPRGPPRLRCGLRPSGLWRVGATWSD